MKRERWEEVQSLFAAADARPPSERRAWLAERCGEDLELFEEVVALLEADAEAGDFLEDAVILAARNASAPSHPATIGRYRIDARIGTGGFGVVYRGWDPELERPVAVKTLALHGETSAQRFAREARIAARLRHVHITVVHDLGVDGGLPFLVQELLDGEDLDALIERREDLAVAQRLRILSQVASGLAHAHRLGVLHRDIKPGNIRILASGDAKILDFGIAKLVQEDSGLTGTGVTLGTIGYFAPEQLRGQELDRRADIFSFGILAYELLTYRRPFEGSTFSAASYQLLYGHPPPLARLWPDCPERLAEIVGLCLERDLDQRLASLDAIPAELDQIAESCRSMGSPRLDSRAEEIVAESPPAGTVALPDRGSERGPSRLLPWVALPLVLLGLWAWSELGPKGASPPSPERPEAHLLEPAPRMPAAEAEDGGEKGDGPKSSQLEDLAATASPPAPREAPREKARVQEGEGAGPSPTGPARADLSSRGVPVAEIPLQPPSPVQDSSEGDEAFPLPLEEASQKHGEAPVENGPPPFLSPGPGVRPPRLLDRPQPAYPPRARVQGREAQVIVAVLVDEEGRVERTLLKRRDRSGFGFNEAALGAARRATYEPATRNGIPGRMWAELVFDFELQ